MSCDLLSNSDLSKYQSPVAAQPLPSHHYHSTFAKDPSQLCKNSNVKTGTDVRDYKNTISK